MFFSGTSEFFRESANVRVRGFSIEYNFSSVLEVPEEKATSAPVPICNGQPENPVIILT